MAQPNRNSQDQPRRIRVELGDRSYEVQIAPGAVNTLGALIQSRAKSRKAFLVIDSALPDPFSSRALASLHAAGFEVFKVRFTASEHDKSLASLAMILADITRHKLERTDVLVALGGGVIGDLAGFAAAVYRRGIPFVQCPTTLLSMVDASVGGKTGVNIELSPTDLKKNMAGAFHQPIGVLADIDALASLSERHYRAGLAECVKHAMLGADFEDPGLLAWMRANASPIATRNPRTLGELIARNVAIKARVVAGDEREEATPSSGGGRALLNLGHTFGHAIEALPGAHSVLPDDTVLSGEIHHGEAVSLGLRAACETSVQLGVAPKIYADEIGALQDAFGLPRKAKGLPATEQILDRMSHDKKNVGGKMRLILPCGGGRATVAEDTEPQFIAAGIDAIRG